MNTNSANISANARRVAKHAEAMRQRGLKRVSIWVSTTDATLIRDFLSVRAKTRQMVQDVAEAKLASLPPLVGSDAQVKWASDIRAGSLGWLVDQLLSIDSIDSWFTYTEGSDKAIRVALGYVPTERERLEIANALRQESSAHWWIETRHMNRMDALSAACRRAKLPRFVQASASDEDAQLVLAETTLRPEKITGPDAEIAQDDTVVRITLAEYSESTNEVIKKRGFRWSAPHWERTLETTDLAGHLAVEMAVRLMSHGSPVRVFDDALRERVTCNNYEPESSRRIDLSESAKYGTKFRVVWSDDAKFTDCTKRVSAIKGVQLFRTGGGAFVPLSRFEEIEDLVSIMGFSINQVARDVIAKEAIRRDAMIGVVPRLNRAPQIVASMLPGGIGGIDASLADL